MEDSSNDVIHSLEPITASNDSFFIGEPTVSYCPLEEYGACPPGNVTAIQVADGGASMVCFHLSCLFDTLQHEDTNSLLIQKSQYVEVPGGQQVYVLPSGALSFAPAHAEGTPITNNGTTTGFTYVNGTDPGELGILSFEGAGWLACPVANATSGMLFLSFEPLSKFTKPSTLNSRTSLTPTPPTCQQKQVPFKSSPLSLTFPTTTYLVGK